MPAWYGFEMLGGGRVGTGHFTEDSCFMKALEIVPNFPKAWCHLGVRGGGHVGTENVTQSGCYGKVLRTDRNDGGRVDTETFTRLTTILEL